jgi:hypothetical protein
MTAARFMLLIQLNNSAAQPVLSFVMMYLSNKPIFKQRPSINGVFHSVSALTAKAILWHFS